MDCGRVMADSRRRFDCLFRLDCECLVGGVEQCRSDGCDCDGRSHGTLSLFLFEHRSGNFWIVTALINGNGWDLPPESLGDQMAQFSFDLAPIIQLNRVISSPASFTPFAPAYWIHFVTGVYCMRLATIVMRNRFRAATVNPTMTAELVTHSTGAADTGSVKTALRR